jgi:hypothetical protein
MEIFQSKNQQVMILRNPSQTRDFLFVTCLFFSYFFTASVSSQGVIGSVRESVSNKPVENALITVLKADSTISSMTTDTNGNFHYVSNDAIRIKFSITGLGYESFLSEEVALDGYSTLRLEYKLERLAYTLEEVTVVYHSQEFTPYLYRITKDQLNNIAGNFDDPVRVAVSSPGIVQINDQANHISVRGQNPVFNSWYLEGLEIVNPNHTNNAGTFSDQPTHSGGGVNMFSAQILGRTDVYTGINPLSIGRTAGAVIDMHLHESADPEFRVKAGFLGFEVGGGKKISEQSFIDVNLRYSFTGLLADMGVDFGGEKIGFYDGVITYHQYGRRHKFKAFGWGGRSTNDFTHVMNPDEIEEYKDFFDIFYSNDILGLGLRYNYTLNDKTSFTGGASYSLLNTGYDREGQFGPEPVSIHLNDDTRILSAMAEFSYRVAPTVSAFAGLNYTYRSFNNDFYFVSVLDDESFLRPYINTTIDISSAFSVELGGEINYAFSYLTDGASTYPGYRAQLQWNSKHQLIYAGVRHSAAQNIATFGPEEPWRLPLIVDKYEIGWILSGQKNTVSIKPYYQKIKNMPVFYIPGGYIHLADAMDPIAYGEFSEADNEGKAHYYGIEGEWKYSNQKGFNFQINQTVYESQRAEKDFYSEGHFDGLFGTNISLSKEIVRHKKGKNRIWNFSARGMMFGGLREQNIDENYSQYAETTKYVNPGIFPERIEPYKRIDAGISKTIANSKIRWRYALDIQNLFGFTNIAYRFYDPFLDRIESKKQLGIIPVLSVQASW